MVTEKHAPKDPVKIISKHIWEFAQNQDFDESINTFDHSFLIFNTAVRLSMQNLTRKKTNVFWRNNLNLRNKINQSEKHFFDSSHCEISKIAVKKIDFPQLSYSIIVLVLVLLHSSEVIDAEFVWQKTTLCWRTNLTVRNKMNQSSLQLLNVSLCINFNSGVKKFGYSISILGYNRRVWNWMFFWTKSIFNQ